MRDIHFSEEYKELIVKLNEQSEDGDTPVFPTLRELMLFAAMLGKKENSSIPRKGQSGTVDIKYFEAEGFKKDGIVYLVSLLDTKDPSILKGDASEAWKLFESYVNGGMKIMQGWLVGLHSHDDIVEELIRKIGDYARKTQSTTGPTIKVKKKPVISV